jgi:NADP-dependent aldehyde dehydrogenase
MGHRDETPGRAGLGGVERAAELARRAWHARAGWAPRRAELLERISQALEEARDPIIASAADESGLTIDELAPECARMVGTLRMFARVVREGSWVRAAIDRRGPGPSVGPGHDVRRMLVPVGPVGVFGASNFPLAYGVCGGDTASAIAAGCPVVVKEHPAHPKTGRMIHERASEAITGLTDACVLGYVEDETGDPAIGAALVRAPVIAAVGFTGSREGGLALERVGAASVPPKPVFAEMGSANRVLVFPDAARERGEQIADELAASVLARHGQQCTKPGVIVLCGVDAPVGRVLIDRLVNRLDAAEPRRMLSPRVRARFVEGCRGVLALPGVRRLTREADPAVDGPGPAGESSAPTRAVLAEVEAGVEWPAEVLEEVFGPFALVLHATGADAGGASHGDLAGLLGAASAGCLATSVYAQPTDAARVEALLGWGGVEWGVGAGLAAGRVVFNGVPTGVRVGWGMVHAGPWPATNRPESSAVGPMSLERWCRPVCWQNAPDSSLPPALQEGNPLGIVRWVDGELGRDGARG